MPGIDEEDTDRHPDPLAHFDHTIYHENAVQSEEQQDTPADASLTPGHRANANEGISEHHFEQQGRNLSASGQRAPQSPSLFTTEELLMLKPSSVLSLRKRRERKKVIESFTEGSSMREIFPKSDAPPDSFLQKAKNQTNLLHETFNNRHYFAAPSGRYRASSVDEWDRNKDVLTRLIDNWGTISGDEKLSKLRNILLLIHQNVDLESRRWRGSNFGAGRASQPFSPSRIALASPPRPNQLHSPQRLPRPVASLSRHRSSSSHQKLDRQAHQHERFLEKGQQDWVMQVPHHKVHSEGGKEIAVENWNNAQHHGAFPAGRFEPTNAERAGLSLEETESDPWLSELLRQAAEDPRPVTPLSPYSSFGKEDEEGGRAVIGPYGTEDMPSSPPTQSSHRLFSIPQAPDVDASSSQNMAQSPRFQVSDKDREAKRRKIADKEPQQLKISPQTSAEVYRDKLFERRMAIMERFELTDEERKVLTRDQLRLFSVNPHELDIPSANHLVRLALELDKWRRKDGKPDLVSQSLSSTCKTLACYSDEARG